MKNKFVRISLTVATGVATFVVGAAVNALGCYQNNGTCFKTATHVYESVASSGTTYVGFVNNGTTGNPKYRMAYCKVSGSTQTLEILHDTTDSGAKGAEITVSSSGFLLQEVSLCGTSGADRIVGAGALIQTCNGKSFGPLKVDNYGMSIQGLAGNDEIIGIAGLYNHLTEGEVIYYCGGPGNDYLDSAYTIFGEVDVHVPEAYLHGGDGNDGIVASLSQPDECYGGNGDDSLIDCHECSGGSGTDICECNYEQSCEANW